MPNTKENLVELLNDVCAKGFWRYGVDQRTGEEGGHEMTAEDIADYLMENGTVQKWIPVKDRLPELHTKVLCCGIKGGRFIAELGTWGHERHLYWDKKNGRGCPEVTHWMPLPDPPKGE